MSSLEEVKFQLFHWHVEASSKCALKCPRCPRTEFPSEPRLNKELKLLFIKKIFTEGIIKKTKRITFCGDVGDPIYASEFLDIIKYLKTMSNEVEIYIITNGSYRSKEWWKELSLILNDRDTIAFSIDGFDEASNRIYRKNSDWDSIMTGLEIMTSARRAFVLWAMIVFKFNQDKIADIIQFAREKNVDEFQITKSLKFGNRFSVYKDASGDDPLEPNIEWIADGGRYERKIQSLSNRIRPKSDYLESVQKNLSHIQALNNNRPILPLCAVGNRGLFVSADGQLWPCAWVSYPHAGLQSLSRPQVKIEMQDSFFRKNYSSFSLYDRSISEILNDPLMTEFWSSMQSHEKMFVECEKKCLAKDMLPDFITSYYTD